MSKALERVQNALKADEQRHAVRLKVGAKVDSRNLGLLLDDLGDFRPDVKRGEFKKMVHRMLVINRSLKVGIKRSNLKEWHELSKFRPAADEDHKAFISGILNNFQLMARFTRFLRQSQDFFQKAEEEYLASGRPIGPSEFLNLMAQKLHEAKISTAHLCWHEVVKPLRTHSTNQQIGIDTLKSQLKQLRSDYLKEISALRDTKRNGSDPLDAIPDIRYFYEPLHSLEPQEQKFMIDLIREVLKMMMDSDFASGKVKSSALERFVSEVHDNELKQLKDEISAKNSQLKELRQAQHFLETQILTGCRSSQSATNTLEKMLNITEVLLRAKASAEPVDDFGRKAPLYAILPPWDGSLVDNTEENLTVKTVQLLARARTNLDDGGTHAPIVEAVKLQNFPAVAALLACAVEPKGLHEAVEEGSLDIMDALIIAQANPFVKDDKSRTVMDVALATNDEEVIDTIRDFIGDLRRQKHQHLKMMDENKEEEEAQDALDRDNFLEPTEHKETFGGKRGVVAQEEATEYFAALGSIARSVFKRSSFQAFMFLCLFVALFAADVFVIANVDNDVLLDTILVVLLCAFILEFGVQVLAYRRTYTCSFYFWMDLLGILSVPLDHSLVVNALPSGLDSNTAIMRAARMAKLGARAGRFTKLVKLLRFLPFMQNTNSGGTAKVISAALNIALSMRVSLLIILMVLVLPLFQLATFPENDYSMLMFVEMIGETASVEPSYLEEVFGNFSAFYASSSYFPFQATYNLNGTALVRSMGDSPVRPRASVQLQAGGTTVLFNFTAPQQVDAGLNCLLMVTIMVLMVVSALFLSNTVSHIVLTPLEQLLDHVHHMSANIFKSMAALGTKSVNNSEDGEDQDSADAFGTETRLLDQVLKKIIALSKITVKKSPIDSDSLRRLGGGSDLAWLQAYSNDFGLNEVAYQNAVLLDDVPLSDVDVSDLATLITTVMEDVSIDWDVFQQWELDTLDLSTQDRHNLSVCLLFSQRANAIRDKVKIAGEFQDCCAAFLKECAAGYDRGKLAPYHTFGHAVDATFTLWRTLDLIAAETYLGHLECFGLTVAALAHDIGHMGRSNVFLTEIEHELAICYNDMSCLENMHCSKLFQILAKHECNLFSELNEVIYSHIRHIIVDSIIATDFAQHGGMVKEFESMYGVNAELFDTADEMYMNTEEFPPRELMEYFKTPDVKKTLRTVLLHFADISNPMKPFPVAERWAELVLKEFALQGEEEKALGIPVGPLNDKKTVSLPLSQIGFIEFVVAPLALAMARVLPPVWFTNQMIIDNANIWMDKWIEDTLLKPSLEEQVQVRERIHRMVQKTEQRGFTATLAQMEN